MRRAVMFILPLLVACQPIENTSRTAGKVVKEATNNEVSFWRDVFTYHPPKPPQEPQTRYCYKTQSDIVCYDSLQSAQTAKLNGYQDGNQISWVQPGGGSLGASGGGAVGPRLNSGVHGVPGSESFATGSSVGSAPIADTGTIIVQDTPKYTSSTKGSYVVVPNPAIKGAGTGAAAH